MVDICKSGRNGSLLFSQHICAIISNCSGGSNWAADGQENWRGRDVGEEVKTNQFINEHNPFALSIDAYSKYFMYVQVGVVGVIMQCKWLWRRMNEWIKTERKLLCGGGSLI